MATVDLQALRDLFSELVGRHGEPEWIVRLGDATDEQPPSFAVDIDSGEWFATVQVSANGDLFYEQLASDSGRSSACEEHSALAQTAVQEHLERIVLAQRSRNRRQ
jgi:hypothetical protein